MCGEIQRETHIDKMSFPESISSNFPKFKKFKGRKDMKIAFHFRPCGHGKDN
jgi:hypothetical protein